MRARLLNWLVCPICKNKLGLVAIHSERHSVREEDWPALESIYPVHSRDEVELEVVTGALTCAECRSYYPIHQGVPRMLTYPTQVTRLHAQQGVLWISEKLRGFNLPKTSVPPGEASVLQNFSTEWTNYNWSGDAYWSTTPTNVLEWMRFSLGIPRHQVKGKLLLDVGIGIGGIADALARSEECEIIGMDLGYSVDRARQYFGQNGRLHIVQASLFAPPFASGTFDVVYSQGVLHHTFSTKLAFSSIASLPKYDGMLYVWVYSLDDERATFLRRVLMVIERAARPIISRLPSSAQTALLLPTLPFYIGYQNLYRRREMGTQLTPRYGWNEALHAARDRLTPPFAHRHTYEEMADWFRAEGYRHLEMLRDEILPSNVPPSHQRCVGIRGFSRPEAGDQTR